jgi:transposase
MAAGKKVEPHVATLIRVLLDDPQGRSIASIARELHLSRMTIYRIRLAYDLFGTPYAPSFMKTGRPTLLTYEQEGVSEVFALLAYADS